VLGAFGPDTSGVAASHNGDSALFFPECRRAGNEGKRMSDGFVLVLTVNLPGRRPFPARSFQATYGV